MRFRTDGNHAAAEHARVLRDPSYKPFQCRNRKDSWSGNLHDRARCGHHGQWWKRTPPALPGDTWRIRWYTKKGKGPIAGYDVCCPKCGENHAWTTANNCSAPRRTYTYKDTATGKMIEGSVCIHSGKSSCWNWTGSAEHNQLSATPSLLASGACGWHGFLTAGVLRSV